MVTTMCGPGGSFQPGDVLHVEPARGRALVAGNYAIEIVEKTPERAVITAPENTLGAPQRSKNRGR